jgi:5-formyltetrahydrofolate cyclo-ligase
MASRILPSKSALRWRMRRHRLALAAASPCAARQAANLAPVDRLAAFRVVSGYHPVGGEIDPGPLLGRLAALGCRLALPAAVARGEPLRFRAADGALVADALGIPSPSEHATVLVPDLVIAPVLAFDRSGGRLGQGAGLFDRTLAGLRSSGHVFVLGLAYAGQEVDSVFFEPHDEQLDAILTEAGYCEFPGSSR